MLTSPSNSNVACMPYSNHVFMMAVPSQRSDDFLYALGCCLKHLGGSPKIVVTDNLKASVIKADRYEPEINRIIDDFGIGTMDRQQQLDFLEIIEDRHARKSTIISSQLPPANWFDLFSDETIADAFMYRMIHTSHRIEFKNGESLRKKN